MTPLIPYHPPRTSSDLDAALADFLRVDVANGDASQDTIRNYRSEVELWVTCCLEQDFDSAAVTVTRVNSYRQALIEANYSPIPSKPEVPRRSGGCAICSCSA